MAKEITNIEQCIRGWFIGNFDNTILKTKDFEVAYMKWKKGAPTGNHYQRIATEYNLIIRGHVLVNGKEYKDGDFFIFEPYVACECKFLKDTEIVVVKTPSIPSDKVDIVCK